MTRKTPSFMNYDDDKRIEAYLNQEMPAAEAKAFEAELLANEELRAELARARRLNAALAAYAQHKLRAIASEVRKETGQIPSPEISVIDRMRYFLYTPRHVFLLLAGATIAGLFLLANLTLTPLVSLPAKYFIEPYNPSVAGAGPVPWAVMKKAFDFYSSGKADSLEQLGTSVPGQYYLAHLHLSQGAFEQAEEYFDRTLAGRDSLETYINDWGKVKFNRQLAALGASQSRRQGRAGLKALLEDPECGGKTRSRASDLLQDLENPLRYFSLR